MSTNQYTEAPRVDVSSIEKDLMRGGSRVPRRLMRVVVNPLSLPMPGGYLCERGENVIAVPENKVASIMSMVVTEDDRVAWKIAERRFAEGLEAAKKEGLSPEIVGFSVHSFFREVSGHDYPALESAEFIDDGQALPPEVPQAELRATEANARMMAQFAKEVIFAKPDEN